MLTKEYYALQMATEKRLVEMGAQLSDKGSRLEVYERLEKEMDDVILQAADGTTPVFVMCCLCVCMHIMLSSVFVMFSQSYFCNFSQAYHLHVFTGLSLLCFYRPIFVMFSQAYFCSSSQAYYLHVFTGLSLSYFYRLTLVILSQAYFHHD